MVNFRENSLYNYLVICQLQLCDLGGFFLHI